MKFPALQVNQRGVALIITALPLSELRKHAKVDYWRPDNPEGYQRPVIDRRLAEVAKYVVEGEGLLPTSVLVCAREDDPDPVVFQPVSDLDGFGTFGNLTIPDGAVLWLVDGQHRFYGVNRAYERDQLAELDSYPFPVTIMTGVDRFKEMIHFSLINTTQRKMLTDIVDRHLVIKAQYEGHQMIAKGKAGEKEYQRAKATRIVDAVHEETGPWFHRIQVPGVVGKDQGLFRQHGMVASLEPVLKDPWIASNLAEADVAKLLGNYWRALEEVWPDAFASPDEYRVQATVGVYSLHMVLPSVVQVCLRDHDLSQTKMKDIWEETGVPSDFWHKTNGDPLTLGTGMASIRALAQYLREQLPKVHGLAVKM